MLKFSTLTVFICLLANLAIAQRGGRLGVITGVSKISINNANDAAADDKKLALLNTMGAHYGIEAGYHFRYFGVSAQLMRSQAGQNYMVNNTIPAQTRFVYLKPTFLLHFNTNPKNDVRLIAYAGVASAQMTKYTDAIYGRNSSTGAIVNSNWENKTWTISDTGIIKADLSEQLFKKTDVTMVAGLGGQFRLAKKWLLDISARMDMGMQPIDNLSKLTLKYQNKDLGSVLNYEPWANTPYRFTKDFAYKTARAPSNNMSMGLFVGLKYMLFSGSIYEYEMNGY